MRGASVKWPNWGSGFRAPTLFIPSDFSRTGVPAPNLLEYAIVCPGNCGSFFVLTEIAFLQKEIRYSAFWSWCVVQISFGNTDNFPIFWKCTLISSFKQKPSHFSCTNRILQTFPCKMLFIGLNIEFPGAIFLMKSAGAKPCKNTHLWEPRALFFLQKVQGTPCLGGIPAAPQAIFWRKRTSAFHAKSIIKLINSQTIF